MLVGQLMSRIRLFPRRAVIEKTVQTDYNNRSWDCTFETLLMFAKVVNSWTPLFVANAGLPLVALVSLLMRRSILIVVKVVSPIGRDFFSGKSGLLARKPSCHCFFVWISKLRYPMTTVRRIALIMDQDLSFCRNVIRGIRAYAMGKESWIFRTRSVRSKGHSAFAGVETGRDYCQSRAFGCGPCPVSFTTTVGGYGVCLREKKSCRWSTSTAPRWGGWPPSISLKNVMSTLVFWAVDRHSIRESEKTVTSRPWRLPAMAYPHAMPIFYTKRPRSAVGRRTNGKCGNGWTNCPSRWPSSPATTCLHGVLADICWQMDLRVPDQVAILGRGQRRVGM